MRPTLPRAILSSPDFLAAGNICLGAICICPNNANGLDSWPSIADVGIVKLVDIEQEALALPDGDRASLIAKLLGTFPPIGTDITDVEVEERDREIESGQVITISHQEFVRRVEDQRGR